MLKTPPIGLKKHGRRFKTYPAYKDSGVEWLGEIPAHWEVKRLKAVGCLHTGGTPSGLLDEAFDVDGVPWVKPDHLQGDRGIDPPDRKLAQRAAETVGIVSGGSVLVCGIGTVGKTGFALGEVCTNQQINAITFGPEIIDRFGQFLAPCLEQEFARRANKVTIAICNKSEMGEASVCVPPRVEQQTITAFLNRETARIDALVAKKERLIELLQEKRTALITRAVTKGLPGAAAAQAGLDPTVPMKDPGVEWLGEIPAHWRVKRLKHLLRRQKGAIKTGPFGSQLQNSEMLAGDIKVYNQRSVLDRDFATGENYISLQKFEELRSFEAFPGDLLITTRGSIGRCAVLPVNAERGILHPCLMRIQVDQREISTRFLEVLIQECEFVLDQLRLMSNATTIDVIYSESLKEVSIVLPPLKEQEAILVFLDRKKENIDKLNEKIRDAIDRLKDYRTALISAAVTGKIDVRQEAAV